jgi:hypothetical protein
MRAGSNHVRQPAVRQRDDGPDTPRRADLREGLKAQLRTGIHPGESRPSPHALATHHRPEQSTNGSCNHPAARGLRQSLIGLKRRQASITDWSRSPSSSIREAPLIGQSPPPEGLSTLGFDAGRFPPTPPAYYRATWQLPRTGLTPASDDELTTKITYNRSPSSLLGARNIEAKSH